MDLLIAQQLLVSLGLGMLIGLQRERTHSTVAGIRTFPLVTLLGTVTGQLAAVHGGLILAAGFVALAALIFIPNLPKLRNAQISGMTTEVALLLLYALGAFLVSGPMFVAVVTGGVVALLLHWKRNLHRFARAIGERDMQAIMRFVLISVVILPVLPNTAYGPYQVLNPFEIWLMVVLITGMSLCGYVAYKWLGTRGGVVLAGILGGVISSTATTVSTAKRGRQQLQGAALGSLVIMIAAAVSVLRVIVEISVVAPHSLLALGPPLAATFAAMALIAIVAHAVTTRSGAAMPEQGNPAGLKPALAFAIIYAVIKLAVAVAKEHFGSSALYSVAVLSGLVDMDAITLSTSRLVESQGLPPGTGWRMILAATMSNLAFKGIAVAVLGGLPLFRRIAPLFGGAMIAATAVFWLWP